MTDNKLGPCEFVQTGKDSFVCAPVAAEAYSDAACTLPILNNVQCGASPPAYMSVQPLRIYDGCGQNLVTVSGLEIRPVGAALATPSIIYSKDDTGKCLGYPPFAGATYYTSGAPIALSEAVSGTLKNETRGGTLSVDYISASDGSAWVLGARDSKWGACTFDRPGDNATTEESCTPTNLAFAENGNIFTDNTTCSGTPVGFNSNENVVCPPLVAQASGAYDGCTAPASHYLHVTEKLPVSSVSQSEGDNCLSAPPGYVFFRLGDAIDANAFATAKVTTSKTERVTIKQIATTSGAFLQQLPNFYDNGVRCEDRQFQDGAIYCVPLDTFSFETAGPNTSSTYADAACTQPVIYTPIGNCGSAPTIALETQTVAACGSSRSPPVRAHAIGAIYTGPVYIKDGDAPCRQDTATNALVRLIGEDVTSTLPLLTPFD